MSDPNYTYSQLVSSDGFFFFGDNSLRYECSSMLVQILEQPQRSMFFNRSFGVGVKNYENYPNTLNQQVGLRYAIVNSVSKNNNVVTTGANEGEVDRRIAVSQASISFNQGKNGEMDITVLFIMYADYNQLVKVQVPSGVVK